MANRPAYAATPKLGIIQATVANTNRDGTGTLATLFTAGSSGARIAKVSAIATGTTTAGMLRLYIDRGGTIRMIAELAVSAITPSATVKAFTNEFTLPDPCLLQAADILKVSTHNAETFNLFAETGDF